MIDEEKYEIIALKENLKNLSINLTDVHKLVSVLNQFCKANSDVDQLYEVSYMAELIEEKIMKVSFDLYNITNDYNNQKSIEEIFENLKAAMKSRKVKLVDD